jgi:DnaK suppressor protein
MTDPNSALGQDFIQKQKRRLELLRNEVLSLNVSATSDARTTQGALGNEPRDTGDEAANFARGEIDKGLLESNASRLREIERALEKIGEGSYGMSDVSREPIPKSRLEAVPEAVRLATEDKPAA